MLNYNATATHYLIIKKAPTRGALTISLRLELARYHRLEHCFTAQPSLQLQAAQLQLELLP